MSDQAPGERSFAQWSARKLWIAACAEGAGRPAVAAGEAAVPPNPYTEHLLLSAAAWVEAIGDRFERVDVVSIEWGQP